jgi:hypothetical protein
MSNLECLAGRLLRLTHVGFDYASFWRFMRPETFFAPSYFILAPHFFGSQISLFFLPNFLPWTQSTYLNASFGWSMRPRDATQPLACLSLFLLPGSRAEWRFCQPVRGSDCGVDGEVPRHSDTAVAGHGAGLQAVQEAAPFVSPHLRERCWRWNKKPFTVILAQREQSNQQVREGVQGCFQGIQIGSEQPKPRISSATVMKGGCRLCRPPEADDGRWGPPPPPQVGAMLKGRLALRLLGGKEGETLAARVGFRDSQRDV